MAGGPPSRSATIKERWGPGGTDDEVRRVPTNSPKNPNRSDPEGWALKRREAPSPPPPLHPRRLLCIITAGTVRLHRRPLTLVHDPVRLPPRRHGQQPRNRIVHWGYGIVSLSPSLFLPRIVINATLLDNYRANTRLVDPKVSITVQRQISSPGFLAHSAQLPIEQQIQPI
jgi:hypothetical protein